MEHGEFCRGFG